MTQQRTRDHIAWLGGFLCALSLAITGAASAQGGAPVANAVTATAATNSANDTVPLNITGGAATSVAVSTQASHGTATASGSAITYTPASGYAGSDSFAYTATNGSGTSPPATVSLTVSGGTLSFTYDDRGRLSTAAYPDRTLMGYAYDGASNRVGVGATPIANAASASVIANSTNNLVSLSITGAPATSVAVSGAAGHGTAVASGTSISYTPISGYTGADSFQYTASNPVGTSAPATATITVGTVTLTISKSHTGNFSRGQTGATYTIVAGNASTSAVPTVGTVQVTDTLPNVANTFVPTAMAGQGWSCTLSTLTCTRSDALAPGAAYAAITLTVNVPSNITQNVTNSATVSGGGARASVTATDSTHIGGTLTITTMSLPAPSVGTSYSQAIAISGGTAPFTFAVSTGNLPTGRSLASSTALFPEPRTRLARSASQ